MNPAPVQKRLRPPGAAPPRWLPELCGDEDREDEGDGTTSSAVKEDIARREAVLKSRRTKRSKMIAAFDKNPMSQNMTPLESRAVTAPTFEK